MTSYRTRGRAFADPAVADASDRDGDREPDHDDAKSRCRSRRRSNRARQATLRFDRCRARRLSFLADALTGAKHTVVGWERPRSEDAPAPWRTDRRRRNIVVGA